MRLLVVYFQRKLGFYELCIRHWILDKRKTHTCVTILFNIIVIKFIKNFKEKELILHS